MTKLLVKKTLLIQYSLSIITVVVLSTLALALKLSTEHVYVPLCCSTVRSVITICEVVVSVFLINTSVIFH